MQKMDIDNLNSFVNYCNELLPIDIGVICYTDMSDGKVIRIDGKRVELWHMYKGYEQWWNIKEIQSAETNISRYGINECLKKYIGIYDKN